MKNKSVLRIAQIIGNAKSGGVISCVLNYYRHIDRSKFQFDFYTYGKSPFDEEIRALGGRIFHFSDIHNFPKAYFQLKKAFSKEQYYAVHAHMTTLSFLSLAAAKAAKIKNRICHAHSTTHISEKSWIIKSFLKHFSKLFATDIAGCSLYSGEWLYGKGNKNNFFLLHNAIDLERFNYTKEKDYEILEKYALPNKKIIGSVGRLVFQKNYSFLLKAFNTYKNIYGDNAHLVIIGEGKEKDKLQKIIDSFCLNKDVTILSETKSIEQLYKVFDLFVLTSRFEGLPLVAIEAQAIGIPCLLSQEITKETNISGKCRFIPIKNTKKWAENLHEMLSDSSRYDNTDKVISQGYEITVASERLTNFYLSLGDK